MTERLHRIMASAGLGSRRACEQMILDGRVEVNGRVVAELPVLVGPDDRIRVDGRRLRREPKVYLMLNKPRGVVCTNHDPSGRTRAVDLAPGVRERVFPVGRLDTDTSGLLLLTNDGELSNRLTHPRYEVPKTYEALVDGRVAGEQVVALRQGVRLAEGRARADRIEVIGRTRNQTRLAITLTEGRNRQVRRMLAGIGHKVRRLRRVSVGKLKLSGLGVGRFRPLSAEELNYLRRLAGLAPPERREARPRAGKQAGRGRKAPRP